jgi:DNA-binding transcriptional ArsR family regulator
MTTPTDLAAAARLLGDPARAAMVISLMGGSALAAGELAKVAGITAATASGHLKQLVGGGVLAVVPQGKHRYYRINGPDVAASIEGLGALAAVTAPARGHPAWKHGGDLRFARSCYDHLAGTAAVALHDALVGKALIREDGNGYAVTAEGAATFGQLGIDIDAAARRGRIFARPCLDWSERRPHLGGALGAALLDACLSQGWVRRGERPRLVCITPKGKQILGERLGVRL